MAGLMGCQLVQAREPDPAVRALELPLLGQQHLHSPPRPAGHLGEPPLARVAHVLTLLRVHVAVPQQHPRAAEGTYADDAARGGLPGVHVQLAVGPQEGVAGEAGAAQGAHARGFETLVALHVDLQRALVGHPLVARGALVRLGFRPDAGVQVPPQVGLEGRLVQERRRAAPAPEDFRRRSGAAALTSTTRTTATTAPVIRRVRPLVRHQGAVQREHSPALRARVRRGPAVTSRMLGEGQGVRELALAIKAHEPVLLRGCC